MIFLVSIAFKFSEQGGVTLALCRETEAHWSIQVSDTGAGIPEEEQATIFDPFAQGNNAAGSPPNGTGLGLSIVKRLAEAMDGTILLESDFGRGSTFKIQLPLQQQPS